MSTKHWQGKTERRNDRMRREQKSFEYWYTDDTMIAHQTSREEAMIHRIFFTDELDANEMYAHVQNILDDVANALEVMEDRDESTVYEVRFTTEERLSQRDIDDLLAGYDVSSYNFNEDRF